MIWRRQGIGYVPKDCEGLFILSTSLHYIKCAGDTQGRLLQITTTRAVLLCLKRGG